ncbi:transcriptional regulator [Paenibacillus elgii]|uniref:Transcriptional regulator n=1 Tax=Paenibacillus elgii TaxID=189691 RepID=A0A163WDX2_9BACL|nr:TetR/AcrR family transcriptional regulator [Paenibacillus elgii]KZE76213.1 transcriptional regulator [Paenibacillus elgii]
MDAQSIPLRELKKARTKLALYEASLELIGERSFRELLVDDICRKAEVSKVTFFKFFRQKEDVLVYFMRVWLTWRRIELAERPLRGMAAIRHMLGKVVEEAETKPGLMLSLIGFLSEMKMHPCMPELSAAEVRLLFPGHEELGVQEPDLHQEFTKRMQEAAEDGELRPGVSAESAVVLLHTIFYGAYLTGHLYGNPDLMGVYDMHLEVLGNVREKGDQV